MILEQPDGTVVPIFGSAAPIINLDGGVTAAVVIFEDITERKLEENYKQRLLEIEQQLTRNLVLQMRNYRPHLKNSGLLMKKN